MRRSVLDDLGEEVTGIVAPVSICMALTVALVRILNPEGESNSGAVFLASAYYSEQPGDSTSQKLSGALLNALIFIGVVAAMTVVLVLLFKYGCVKFIYAYMGLAGFSIFFVLAGIILLELLQKWDVQTDFISISYLLFNFAMVGSVTLFFFPAPLLMKQGYLVLTGVVTAYVFTWIPEWTTWVLLVAMAVYDVVAVLVPGGPLKVLVELAQEREEPLPALVYEARPVRRDASRGAALAGEAAAASVGTGAAAAAGMPPPARDMAAPQQQELPPRPPSISRVSAVSVGSVSLGGSSSRDDAEAPLIRAAQRQPAAAAGGQRPHPAGGSSMDPEAATLAQAPGGPAQLPAAVPGGAGGAGQEGEEDEGMFELPEAIKLGLGDFIFYSVLVGRAAMYDFMAVFACYLAIIAGLCLTLLWLAMARKALPALPISITLAVIFFFVSRYVMEPVILPMALEFAFF